MAMLMLSFVPFGTGAGAFALQLGLTAAAAAVDALYVMPGLFGKNDQRVDYGSVGIQASDEGSPVYRCLGPYNRIPATVIYASAPRSVSRAIGGGKRGEQVEVTWFSDLVLAFHWTDSVVNLERVLADGSEVVDNRPDFSLDLQYGNEVYVGYDRRQIRGQGSATINQFRLDYWHMHLETPRLGTAVRVASVAADSSGLVLINLVAAHGRTVGSSFYVIVGSLRDATSSYHIDHPILHWATATTIQQIRINHTFSEVFPSGSPTLTAASAVSILRDEAAPSALGMMRDLMRIDLGKPVGLHFVHPSGPSYDPGFLAVAKEDLGDDLYQLVVDIDDGSESGFGGFGDPDTRYLGPHPVLPGAPASGLNARFEGRIPSQGRVGTPYPGLPALTSNLRITQTREQFREGAATSWEFPHHGSGGIPTQQPRSTLIGAAIGEHLLPAYRPLALTIAKEFNLSMFGNRVPNFEGYVGTVEDDLGTHVAALCSEWGVTADTSSLSGTLLGYAWTGRADLSQLLQPLAIAYDFVAQESEEGVRFFHRDGSLESSVTTGIMLPRADGGPVKISRSADAKRYRSVTVTFYDHEKDLTRGSVIEHARGKSSGDEEIVNLPLTLFSDDARAIALRILRLSHIDLVYEFALPPQYADLAENDVISFAMDGRTHRVRLVKVDVGRDWGVDCTGIPEPEYAVSADTDVDTVLGSTWYGGSDGGKYSSPPMALEVFTGISLREGESSARGYYVAATPFDRGSGFFGAVVHHSLDGGVTWAKKAEIPPANLGYLEGEGITAVGVSDGLDDSSLAIVDMVGVGEVSSADAEAVEAGIAGQMLIGDELVGVTTASLNDDGTYSLSELYRGVGGTAVASHSAGTRLLSIDDAVVYIPLEPHETGREILVRVVPFGGDIDTAKERAITIPAVGDVEGEAVDWAVTGFAGYATSDGVLLVWNAVDHVTLKHYEIRRGATWGGAEVVYRGTEAKVHLRNVPSGVRTYWIRAMLEGGLFSAGAASATVTATVPDGETVAASLTDLVSGSTGTPVDCTYDPGGTGENYLALDTDVFTATYTSAEMDAGSVANWLWTLEVDSHEIDNTLTVDLLDMTTSPAARWRTLDTLEPWDLKPGADFDDMATDVDGLTSDLTRPTYGPEWGSYGRNTRCKVEARFDTDGLGTWTDYEPFVPHVREAQRMQVRLTLDRHATNYSLRVTRIRAEARS